MDITDGIKVRDGIVEVDCFALGIGTLLRPFVGKKVHVTTHGWSGEAKGSLTSATIELDPAEQEFSKFVLHLEVEDDGEDGTGAKTRLSVPGGR